MSTALAIASITAVLKDLLNNGLIGNDITDTIGGNVKVTALPPDRIDVTDSNEQSQLNLFMYQVTPNQGWCNIGLPSRDSHGERISNPPLALDLHYLLTAYGASELHTEILLGYGMQLMHETPVLAREAIRKSLVPSSPVTGDGLPVELKALFSSELADQIEQVKITPKTMGTEEISKLWAAFQAKYRPTVAYQVSVVLIESRFPTKSALPVRSRKLYVSPFQQPVIEQIKSQQKPDDPILIDQPILAGYNLVIVGKQLRGEETRVEISGTEVTPAVDDMSDTQIILPIPEGLRAGVQSVQVIHRKMMGAPPKAHHGVESNVAAFVLCPKIIGQVNASGQTSVEVTIKPAVSHSQRVTLLLNEPDKSLSYSFSAPPLVTLSLPDPTEKINIPISGVETGTYLVRIKVDGAESPLFTDGNNQYNEPQVTIT